MVLTLAIPLRAVFDLQDFITARHLQNMAKVMLATGLIVVYGYVMELFFGWYSGNLYERFMLLNRVIGPYKWHWYDADPVQRHRAAAPVDPEASARRRSGCSSISMFVSVGMWLERFIIIVTSLPPRLPAVVLGHVPRDDLGLGRRSSARSACSCRCSSSSSASCR